MGYFERIVIGIIIIISAYQFLESSYQRNHFHTLAQQLTECLKCCYCYCYYQTLRTTIAAFIFTGGLALIFDSCIKVGIVAEIGLLAFEAAKLRTCCCMGIYQTIFIHLLILVILVNNLQQQKQESKEIKQVKGDKQRERSSPPQVQKGIGEKKEEKRSVPVEKSQRQEPAPHKRKR